MPGTTPTIIKKFPRWKLLVPLCKTTLFLASLMMVSTEMGYQYVSSLTATACFIFVNHARNAFFSGIGMCCMCLFF